MIVREENEKYILTRQNDHAHLSGEIARHFEHFFLADPHFKDCLFAIYEHDRSWILPDALPEWNAITERPYDFIDYPIEEKLNYYRLGLAETEEMNPYAGLLCSMHYTSFIKKETADPLSLEFLQAENKRQNRLRTSLELSDGNLLHKQFQLLQLCDNISLYLCLNRPGTNKDEEHYFFRKGFKNSSGFSPNGKKDLIAYWPERDRINIEPYPFKDPFEVSIDQKYLLKQEIRKNGLKKAFLQAEAKTLSIQISKG
ncbi:DUF3891 family protein [Aequorivita sp. H23M31]|uniref:DUF3891 family protein n=1 Tax=Aequorivita ciconiae TaxID=2494375 RepID=A0A410FZL4_9FLAO|nr:DUF3891 family protein [Aequorivita sp. H23M31]QAA80472.1 DUF3891 family protein [Aequorivita sp. H23M31]